MFSLHLRHFLLLGLGVVDFLYRVWILLQFGIWPAGLFTLCSNSLPHVSLCSLGKLFLFWQLPICYWTLSTDHHKVYLLRWWIWLADNVGTTKTTLSPADLLCWVPTGLYLNWRVIEMFRTYLFCLHSLCAAVKIISMWLP